jgi:hypothetical protein
MTHIFTLSKVKRDNLDRINPLIQLNNKHVIRESRREDLENELNLFTQRINRLFSTDSIRLDTADSKGKYSHEMNLVINTENQREVSILDYVLRTTSFAITGSSGLYNYGGRPQ